MTNFKIMISVPDESKLKRVLKRFHVKLQSPRVLRKQDTFNLLKHKAIPSLVPSLRRAH